MSGVPYLGCKISLVSKSEIRYEGILYTIDTKESTVALAKVRSFGTEGRPTDRPVAPRDEIYEYIIFRASDIKDLHVSEPAKQQAVLAPGLPNDPAIVQHSAPLSCSMSYGQPMSFGHICGLQPFQHYPSQLTYQHLPSLFSGTASGSRSASSSQTSLRNKSPTIDAGVQVSTVSGEERGSRQSLPDEMKSKASEMNQSTTSLAEQQRRAQVQVRQLQRGRGGNRPGRGRARGVLARVPEPLKFDGEYDFEQANAEFKELETKLAGIKLDDSGTETLTSGDTEEDIAYDKQKSFFDNISCEASRVAKGIPRFSWRTERKLNVETFGVSTSNSWLRRRRGRGGFRRGFRRSGANVPNSTLDMPKTVTFGANKIVMVESSIEAPLETTSKGEEIPTIEIVVEKEKDWEEGKEQWN